MNTDIKIMDGQDPGRPDTYWSIGFRTARTGFLIKYIMVSSIVFFLGVIVPLYIYAPELFSSEGYAALSAADRSALWAKMPVAILIVGLPFCISVAIAIVGQIRRFHDFNKPGWLCILNVFFPAIPGILLLLMAVPGTHGANRYGEDPHERRKREAECLKEMRRKKMACKNAN